MPTFGRLRHRSHPHNLELTIKEEAFNCDVCKDVGFGKRYSCPIEGCDFHIHKECGKPPKKTEHHLLKGHSLPLLMAVSADDGHFWCDACGWEIEGCYYHCKCRSYRRHDLHPCCALQTQKGNISNGRGVDLFLTKELSDDCDLCGLMNLSNGKTSWGYVSRDKTYQLHLYCVKKKLIDHHEDIMLGVQNRSDDGHGESSARALRVINPPDQSQILARDSHVSKNRNKKGWMVSTVNKMLRIVFDLIVAVLLGNPAGLIVDVGSLLFFN